MLMMPACVSSRNKSGNRSGRPCSRSSAASLSGVVEDAKRSADRNLGRLFLIRADAHGGGNLGAYQLDAAVFIGGVLVSGIRRLRLRLRLGLLDAQLTSAESDRPSEVARHSRRSSLIPDSPAAGPASIPRITSEIIVIIIAVIFHLPGGELPGAGSGGPDLQVWIPPVYSCRLERCRGSLGHRDLG